MIKIAYLVFAYKNPKLLDLEIKALSTPESAFFVHIDKKSNINDFTFGTGVNIFVIEDRISVHWAEFSGVEAILKLIRSALQGPERYDYFVLLSGSEYPLKSAKYIQNFFEANYGSEFMDIVRVPNIEAGKPLAHINTYRVQSHRPILRFIVRLLSRLGLIRRDYRKYLGALEPYSGHTWWALTREACEYIEAFIEEHPEVPLFFKNVPQPEESFFHTILGNSNFKSRIRRNLLFEDWSAAGSRPEIMTENHIAFFQSQEAVILNDVFGAGEVLFARKYSDENLALVDLVDKVIKSKEKT